MRTHEYVELKDYLSTAIYPRFGKQPSKFQYWDKQALRVFYAEYFKPHFEIIRNNPKFTQLVDEIQRCMEYE